MENTQFKRGQRVRYVGAFVTSLTGKTGTVTDPNNRAGWVMVQFDHYPDASLKIEPCNLEKHGGAK